MTHFAALVLVPDLGLQLDQVAIDRMVGSLLAPYQEGDEWGADGTRWDWYQIGGRFTGLLDGYNPWDDERNYEWCEYCEGTGTTTQAVADKYPAYQDNVGKPCHQCNVGWGGEQQPFPGKKIKFNYEPHDGDVLPVKALDPDAMRFIPGSVITPDGEWHEQARIGLFMSELPKENGDPTFSKDEWKEQFRSLLAEHDDAIAVLVDCHV